MKSRKLAARALTLLPAMVLGVAAVFQAHAQANLVRAKPRPDAIVLLGAPAPPVGGGAGRSSRAVKRNRS